MLARSMYDAKVGDTSSSFGTMSLETRETIDPVFGPFPERWEIGGSTDDLGIPCQVLFKWVFCGGDTRLWERIRSTHNYAI